MARLDPTNSPFNMAPRGVPEIVRRAELRSAGFSDRELAVAVRDATVHRVRHGAYSTVTEFDQLETAEKHRLAALAARAQNPMAVVSHVSAAAVHGLPLWGTDLSRVHLTRPGTAGAPPFGTAASSPTWTSS